MANNDKENKIKKFTKEAIGKTLNQFNKEIGIADLVEINKNQDRILNGILSQVNDENTEKTEKSNIITLDNSTDGIVELKEIQGDTNVNVSKIAEETPITHVIEDKEGNAISLDDITEGAINIDNIQGNTMVNCNKEADKELILMEDLSTKGYSNVTLTEGVDGGKVDIALEGNTMVNVCDQKDPVAITKSYTVETGNHVALQGEYDGKCRPVVNGNTLVNLWDKSLGYTTTGKGNFIKENNGVTVNNTSETGEFYILNAGYISLLKPNTIYTLIIDIETSNNYQVFLSIDEVFKNIGEGNTSTRFVKSFTSGNNSTRFRLDSDTLGGTVKFKDIMILEGDYTNKPIPGYFEGLQSSFEDKVVPENLATNIISGNVSKYNALCKYRGIKQNTTYTLFIKNNSTTTLGFYLNENVFKYKEYNVDPNSYRTTLITPTKTLDDTILIKALYTMENVNFECYLVEGDYTNYDFSDYDPTKAGKYRVNYEVTGKNKFDKSKCVIGSLNNTTGVETNNDENRKRSNFIPIQPNTTYTISQSEYLDELHNLYFIQYDINKNAIQVNSNEDLKVLGDVGSTSRTFTSSPMAKYLRIRTQDNRDLDTANIQLEEGAKATTYEHYREYNKTFYLNSPLLEGDTIEQSGNNIYHVHRYKKVVLDGSADEGWAVWEYEGFPNGRLFTTNVIPNLTRISTGYYMYSDKYKTPYNHVSNNDLTDKMILSGKSSSSSDVNYFICIADSSYSTANELKSELQQNPVTVVYKLATPEYELISENNTILCDSYTNGHLAVDSVIPIEKVTFLNVGMGLKYLYPDTKYIIQFNSDNVGKIEVVWLSGGIIENVSVLKGLNKIEINTPNTVQGAWISFYGIGFNASNIVVTEATDKDFGYFEGMKSVGECEGNKIEILSQSNLADIATSGNTNFKVANVKAGVSYSIKSTRSNNAVRYNLLLHDINGNGLGTIKDSVSSDFCTFTPFKDGVLFFNAHIGNTLISDIMLVKGIYTEDTMPQFKPYTLDKKQILMSKPLRAVGDIKDKYVLIDGKWYIERNCGEVVFNGDNEGLGFASSSSNNDVSKVVSLRMEDKALGQLNVKSDKLPTIYGGDKIYTEKCVFGQGGQPYIHTRLKISESGSDLSSAKAWLRNNPITVVYQLKTPIYELIDYNPFEVYSEVTHISNNSTIPCNMTIKNTGYNCLLKPSTTYTVSSNLGLTTVTTPTTLTEDCLRFYNTDTSTTKMKYVTILEGDYTTGKPIPSHFSGIESCFEQEYDEGVGKYKVRAKVVGKNLIDTTNYLYKGSNTIVNTSIPGTLNFQRNGGSTQGRVIFNYVKAGVYNINFNVDKTPPIANLKLELHPLSIDDKRGIMLKEWYLPNISFGNTRITIPYSGYIAFSTDYSGDNIIISNVQLEQGTQATPYEPYKESNIVFYIDEPLRGVEGVKDRIYVKDDKVIVQRNCGSVTLNSKNNYYLSAGGWENKTDVCTFEGYIPTPTPILDNLIKHYADIVPSLTFYQHFYESGSKGIEGISTHQIGGFVLSIKRCKLKTQDVNGLDEYLRENPITVVYQLAEPVYEEVECSYNRLILNTFNNESFNNSTLFLDTTILPKLSFKPLYEELVYVKNSTKYYIQFNAVGSGEVVINLGGTELTIEIVEGYNCIPITTPSESTNLMTISGQGITISEVVVSEVVCGGYYKGIQSCFEEHMENGKYRVLLRGIALDGSKVNGIKLYINEPLRGIGDTRDRLCIKDGKLMVERKCGSITFDGSEDENWIYYKSSSSNPITTTSFRIDVDNIPMFSMNLLCDKLDTINLDNMYSGKYGVCTGKSNADRIYISIDVEKLSTQDVNVLKQYLQQNQITVVYQLAQITYEEATNEYGLPIVLEGYESGIVYVDSAVTPTTSIKYTSNNILATTLSKAEEQNIATQEDINMNVVTYMMDIDMILTEMEMSNDTSVMAVRRDNSNENMLDRMSKEDKKVYQDNTVVMLEKMITANVLDREDIERRINMYYDKNRISKEQYEYLKSLL